MSEPMSYPEALAALDDLTAEVRELERDHHQAGENAAATEANYRRELAASYVAYRALGKAQAEADTMARGDCAKFSDERDRDRYAVTHVAELLENRRGERASLHKLVDWSAAIDARRTAA